MAEVRQGELIGAGLRVGIVFSRFNSTVTERLLDGALAVIRQQGVVEEAIEVVQVPGAFEIPLIVEKLASSRRFDALVCLGAVVRGETPHFDFIAKSVVDEIGRLCVAHRLPIALGLLTTENIEQALERSGGKHGNKGGEAASTAIEMANLAKTLA